MDEMDELGMTESVQILISQAELTGMIIIRIQFFLAMEEFQNFDHNNGSFLLFPRPTKWCLPLTNP